MCAVMKHDASDAVARDVTCRRHFFADVPSLHFIYCITPTEIHILFPHALNFIRHLSPQQSSHILRVDLPDKLSGTCWKAAAVKVKWIFKMRKRQMATSEV